MEHPLRRLPTTFAGSAGDVARSFGRAFDPNTGALMMKIGFGVWYHEHSKDSQGTLYELFRLLCYQRTLRYAFGEIS